jgi:3-oxoacyl-(acyl-carrier-protein) synthase
MAEAVAVTGLAGQSCLGATPAEQWRAMETRRGGLRPLGELLPGQEPSWLPAGWITDRAGLAGGRYGPATNLALAVARAAAEDAGWGAAELCDAWLLVGSSRGNLAGWLAPWPGRRPHGAMAASNSMHSELAAAVSIALGIRGPWHVLSNACASGLDALGLAATLVAARMAPRALVVAVDLPLVPQLLGAYASTSLMSSNGVNDPYSPTTTGFLPGEAGAALAIEPRGSMDGRRAYSWVTGYWANSDAFHPLGLPADGAGIADCLRLALGALAGRPVGALCPHASGTLAHGQAERRALAAVFAERAEPLSLHLLKPFTGHAIGASGAIDAVLLCHGLGEGRLPPNVAGLTGAGESMFLPEEPRPTGGMVLKMSVGMGGHNAIVALAPPKEDGRWTGE